MVAALAGLTLDIPQDYKHHDHNEKPPFIDKFASGKIPAFEGKDGFTLFESSAIARYSESCYKRSYHVMRGSARDDYKQHLCIYVELL